MLKYFKYKKITRSITKIKSVTNMIALTYLMYTELVQINKCISEIPEEKLKQDKMRNNKNSKHAQLILIILRFCICDFNC